MYIDKLLELCDAQAITASTVTTNIIDLGSDRDVGPGQTLYLVLSIDVATDGTTGDETYSFVLQTDDAVGYPSAVTLVTVTVPRSTPAGTRYVVPFVYNNERFLRGTFTLAGTTPSVTYSAWITSQEPTYIAAYPNAV